MMASPDHPSRSRRWLLRLVTWSVAVFLIVVVLAVAGIVLFSTHVNSTGRIPDELRTAPTNIVAISRQLPKPAPTASPASLFAAPRKLAPSTTTLVVSVYTTVMETTAPRQVYADPLVELQTGSWFLYYDGFFRKYGDNGAITPQQAQWLREHAGLIGKMRELIADRNWQVIQAVNHANRTAPADWNTYRWISVMVSDAQFQTEQGDYGAARDRYFDALNLLDLCAQNGGGERSYMIDILKWRISLPLMTAIENSRWPDSQWAGIPELLEKLDVKIFDADIMERELIDEYLTNRQKYLAELDAPWNSPIHGWRITRDHYIPTNYYWPGGNEIKIPRVLKFMATTAQATANKQRSADLLRAYDEKNQRAIGLIKTPYPQRFSEMKKAGANPNHEKDAPEMQQVYMPPVGAAIDGAFINETSVHLARVGLLWRIDREKALALRNEDLRGQPHNPWRDPFGEKPFQIEETTSGTLIFSVGFELDSRHSRRARNLHIRLPGSPTAKPE